MKFYRKSKEKNEKMFGMYEILKPNLVITDLDLLQKVLIKDFDHFVDRRNFQFSKKDKLFNEMLTLAEGSYWKSLRSVLTPTFTSGKMKMMFHLVREKAVNAVRYSQIQSDKGEAVDFVDLLGKYAMDAIGTCAFGIDIDSINGNHKNFVDAAKKTTKVTFKGGMKFLFLFLFPKIANKMDIKITNDGHDLLEKVVKTAIDSRKTGERRNDFIDILLDARQSNENSENQNQAFSE